MKEQLLKFFHPRQLTLTERTLQRFSQHKPVSETAKKMFSGETSTTLNQRFATAREKVAEAR